MITYPSTGSKLRLKDGTLVVRGTTTDNARTRRVEVNGVEAKDVDYNFHQWEAKLNGVRPGTLTITAFAQDAEGNVEKLAHEIRIVVAK